MYAGEQIECAVCGSCDPMLLGYLGQMAHFRCRATGMDFSEVVVYESEDEEE